MSKRLIPRSLPLSPRINKFISDFPDLQYTGSVIYCNPCQKDLNVWKPSDLKRHVESAYHKENRKHGGPYWMFIRDLIFMFSVCNIPHNVLDKIQFRVFWETYNPEWRLPSRQELRWYFPRVKEQLENTIRYELRDKKLWLTVDETTDAKKNKVGNVLARMLNPSEPTKSYLLASERLEKNDSDSIQLFVRKTLNKFEIQKDNVLMLVTDNAAYMREAGVNLKTEYSNLLHITCILCTLHIVAGEIRRCYPDVDKLIVTTEKVFVKAAKRTQEIHKACPGMPEPPALVTTRWGTWLNAAFYYNTHFETVKSVILNFDPKDANSIRDCQQILSNPQIQEDLQTIHKNYRVLAIAIDKLQSSSLSLSESLEIVDKVTVTLQTLTDVAGVRVFEEFKKVLRNNPDIDKLRDIKECLCDGRANDFQQHFTYANITSLDVERSFSKYSSTFTSKRRSLSQNTMEGLLMMQVYGEKNRKTPVAT